MITTLRTGGLILDTNAEYKFTAADKKLTIKLTSDGDHKLYGDVNIALTNAEALTITLPDGSQKQDFFNDTFKFTRKSDTTLEYSIKIESGITPTEEFDDLPDSGSAVEANIANDSFDLSAGKYSFFLLDTEDMEFSTSTISIKQLNVGNSGIDGIESEFDETGEGDLMSINNADLSFSYTAEISIKNDDSGVTNIPLVINPS